MQPCAFGRRGRRLEGKHVSLLAAPSRAGRPPRLAIVTAKALGGAVERNRARRRIRAVLEGLVPSAFDLIVTARASAQTTPFSGLREELARLLDRLGGGSAGSFCS